MTTLHVKVTFWDILFGMPRRAFGCPVARAVRRALASAGCRPVSCGVAPDSVTIFCLGWGLKKDIPLPPPAAAFVRRLDDRGRLHLRPFAFDLVIPAATRAEIPAEALEGVAP